MSLNFSSGSGANYYNQALQIHKIQKMGGYKVDTEKVNPTYSFSKTYKDGEIDAEPPKPEEHKINLIG